MTDNLGDAVTGTEHEQPDGEDNDADLGSWR